MLDYGIIGNCVSCALVKKDASIDWMCYPDFDSPSLFGKLLDSEKGGYFSVMPLGRHRVSQRYVPNSAILETTFTGKGWSFAVYDFFPRYHKLLRGKVSGLSRENRLVRILKPLRGRPMVRILFDPRPNYGSDACRFDSRERRISCTNGEHEIDLNTNVDLKDLMGSEPVELDRTKYLVLEKNGKQAYNVKKCMKMMSDTRKYWEGWCRTLVTPESNREIITRSAITLKLLTYSKTGSMVAAATTSIPEELGSERTWDYRFCWIRDAAFCADSFKKIGRDYEARKLMEFVLERVLKDDFIQPMYGINGETRLTEMELDHLRGFGGCGPVRVGNAAYRQIQNDIYGEIIDMFYLYFVYYEYGEMRRKHWRFIRYVVNQIKFNWHRKDASIWEYRDLMDHYTYSKFMCYVGVDRAIKIARHAGKQAEAAEWEELREEIMGDILDNAFDREAGAFTMAYGKRNLDSSLLLMAYHEFLDSDDERLVGTVNEIYGKLRKGHMVKRYDSKDDFGVSKNAFAVCTFWLVDALEYIGEEQKARRLYRSIVTKGNHLGLFSEDFDMRTGRMLGNFPQAYVHLALINSSILLSEWSSKRKRIDWGAGPRKKWL